MGATKKEGGKQRAKSYTHFCRECRSHMILPLLVFVLFLTQPSIQRKFMLPSRYYDGTVVIKAIESDTVHIFQKAVFSVTHVFNEFFVSCNISMCYNPYRYCIGTLSADDFIQTVCFDVLA
ncbi:hypothetical protein C5S36_10800 [Candidatus Methanophagaceae archaeon]|nr:hypothetical protein C5S36_10800 [Methanophagales archaeon]